MEKLLRKNVKELPTPCLLVYKHIVKKNASRMIGLAEQFGVTLRPHFKTSKCVEAAEMQTNGTKRCMAVSTLPEAEYLKTNGFDDILYAVPLSSHKIGRCAKLSVEMNMFSVMVDGDHIVDDLERHKLSGGKKWSVFVKIDCGNGRAGVSCDSKNAIDLVERLDSSPYITFRGLYAHCGDSYHGTSVNYVHEVATRTTERTLKLVNVLKEKGISCPTYGIGSTPSCSNPAPAMSKLTEWHPGNYIFYDVFQMRAGSCRREDIACCVLSRVIGHYPQSNHMIIDCGFTALSLQGGGDCFGRTPGGGYGTIVNHSELKLASMSQEHGIVKPKDDSERLNFDQYPIGMMLRIQPDHSCATCAMHRVCLVADEADVIIEQWKPVSGW